MRAYCFTCQADTLLTQKGACSWCEDKIANRPPRARYGIGSHSYIGSEEFYQAAYKRYQTVRSIRGVAAEVWQQMGYASINSCANSLHEAWHARGWPMFSKSYANTIHGKSRRDHKDQAHRHALRVARGEIRGVKCAGVRKQYPRKGEPCSLYALTGSSYCRHHDPAREHERHTHLARIRAIKEATT